MQVETTNIEVRKEHFTSRLTQIPERRKLSIEQKQMEFRNWLQKTHNVYQWSAPDEIDRACSKIQ